MSELLSGRNFQLWEYFVSHGMLLIRSPYTEEHGSNIDMVFWGVAYIELPRLIGEISLAEPTADEISGLEHRFGRKIEEPDKIWVLQGLQQRSFIVAVHMKIDSFSGDYMAPRLRDILWGE